MRSGSLIPFISAPALAAVFVISTFIANGMTVHALVRPLGFAVAVAVGIAAICWAGLRDRGAFWAFVLTASLMGMYVVSGAAVLALAILQWRRKDRLLAYRRAAWVSTGVAISLLAIVGIRGMTEGAFDTTSVDLPPIELGTVRAGPSIHLLLLDGYPRADVLETLGFDNGEFLRDLTDRGFDVSRGSLSNYDRTPFAVLSMLAATHIHDLGPLWDRPLPEGTSAQQRRVARALLDPPLWEALEGAGYTTRALTATVVHVPIGGADESWDAQTANNFELVLLQRTPLAAPLEWFGFAVGQQRIHVRETLRQFARVETGPSFTFAHVMSPHAPIAFEADGAPADPPRCYPERCAIFEGDPESLGLTYDEYSARFVEQVAYLNQLVLEAVDGLVARDPEAVVILLSDHGIEGTSEITHHRNLIVARTPGQPNLLGATPTNINVIPMILNAYLGTNLPMQPDMLYRSGESPWLDVEPIEEAEP